LGEWGRVPGKRNGRRIGHARAGKKKKKKSIKGFGVRGVSLIRN